MEIRANGRSQGLLLRTAGPRSTEAHTVNDTDSPILSTSFKDDSPTIYADHLTQHKMKYELLFEKAVTLEKRH